MKRFFRVLLLLPALLAIAPVSGRTQTMTSNECLLVIDMQAGIFQMKQPVYEAEALIQAVSNAIDSVRSGGLSVIYTRHENTSFLKSGTDAWQIIPEITPHPEDAIIAKRHPSVFRDTPLEDLLRKRGIRRLRICGLISNGCVKDACLEALQKGYPVTLIANGHSTFYRDAPRLIAQWNQDLEAKGATLLTE